MKEVQKNLIKVMVTQMRLQQEGVITFIEEECTPNTILIFKTLEINQLILIKVATQKDMIKSKTITTLMINIMVNKHLVN